MNLPPIKFLDAIPERLGWDVNLLAENGSPARYSESCTFLLTLRWRISAIRISHSLRKNLHKKKLADPAKSFSRNSIRVWHFGCLLHEVAAGFVTVFL